MAFLIPEVEDQSSKSQSKVISTLYVPFYLFKILMDMYVYLLNFDLCSCK